MGENVLQSISKFCLLVVLVNSNIDQAKTLKDILLAVIHCHLFYGKVIRQRFLSCNSHKHLLMAEG